MIETVAAWARAFGATCLIEGVIVFLFFGRRWPASRRWGAAALGQLATHPAVWFILPVFPWPRSLYLAVAESWAVVVEAATYRLVLPPTSWRRAAACSLLANAASFLTGLLLQAVWPSF